MLLVLLYSGYIILSDLIKISINVSALTSIIANVNINKRSLGLG
jgi:hypothetical protein